MATKTTNYHQIFYQFKVPAVMLVIIVLLTTIPGCDDDKLSAKTILLTSATWRFDFVAHPTPTSQAFFSTFYIGFELTFNADGTYSGIIPADTSDPNFDGVWKFNEMETEVNLDEGTSDDQVLLIEELTEGSFIFMILDDNIVLYTISMRH